MQERYGDTAVDVRRRRAPARCEPIVIQLPELPEQPSPKVTVQHHRSEANLTLRVLLILLLLVATFWGSPTLAPVRQQVVGIMRSQPGAVEEVDAHSSLAQGLPTLPIDPLVVRVRTQPEVDVTRVALDSDHGGERKREPR